MDEGLSRRNIPSPMWNDGQFVEAVDSIGYWTRATVVTWVNEGERIGTESDEVGPGFEVNFHGWNKEWNRIYRVMSFHSIAQIIACNS